jgi:hypothetical protein
VQLVTLPTQVLQGLWQGSHTLVASLAIVTKGVQLVVQIVPLRKKNPARQERQVAAEVQVAQGGTQLTHIEGLVELEPYMPGLHAATQIWAVGVTFRNGKVELETHPVQKVGVLKQVRQLGSQAAHSRVALLL